VPEPCGLSVPTPVLTICPGGTPNQKFETSNTSGCTRFLRFELADTSGGAVNP